MKQGIGWTLAAAAMAAVLAGCEVTTSSNDQAATNAAVDNAANAAAAATEADSAQVNAAGSENAAAATAAAGPADPASAEKPLAIAAAAASGVQWGPCPPGLPQGCQLAVLHGDPAKPGADVFLKIPAGASIAPHWHSSAERMMLATGRLEVKYQGALATTLEPGTYAFGPARLPHRADCRSAEPCTLFIAFDGPVDLKPYQGEL